MNITEYLPVVVFGLAIVFFVWAWVSSASRIRWLQKLVADRDRTITDLNNRLMSKSFDQYKMYEQPIQEVIPTEPEEFFDEQAVGKITGEEIDTDA